MDKKLRKPMKRVYEHFEKNDFLSSNSSKKETRKLYEFCKNNTDEVYEYYSVIGLLLQEGHGYFYLAKDREPTMDYIERRVKHAIKAISYIEFMLVYDSGFGEGDSVSSREISLLLSENMSLKDRLKSLIRGEKKTDIEAVEFILKGLVKMGYMEILDEYKGTYKVLSSYNYIKELANRIEIASESEEEESE